MADLLRTFIQSLATREEIIPGGAARLLEMGSDYDDDGRAVGALVKYLQGDGGTYLTPAGKSALRAEPVSYLVDRLGVREGSKQELIELWAGEMAGVPGYEPMGPDYAGLHVTDGSPRASALPEIARRVVGRLERPANEHHLASAKPSVGEIRARAVLGELQDRGVISSDVETDALASQWADLGTLSPAAAAERAVRRMSNPGYEELRGPGFGAPADAAPPDPADARRAVEGLGYPL